jgi:hypothetical protein
MPNAVTDGNAAGALQRIRLLERPDGVTAITQPFTASPRAARVSA